MVRSPFRYKKPPKSINGPLFSNGPNRSPILILGSGHQAAESSPSSSFASMFRDIFHPPSSKKSDDDDVENSANGGFDSTTSPSHGDEDDELAGSQDNGHRHRPQPAHNSVDSSRLPPNASGIVKKYRSPTAREAPNKDGDAFCSPHPGDSDKPSNTPRE